MIEKLDSKTNLNSYNNIKDNFILEKINLITSIKNQIEIYDFELLKDGRILLSLNKCIIQVYNSENFEKLNEQKILKNNSKIKYIKQMKNENILPSIYDSKIYILKLNSENYFNIVETINAHINSINQTIELNNKNLVSISCDKYLKIWKKNNKNKYENIKEIILGKRLFSIIEIKDNIIAYDSLLGTINFYDLNNYKMIKSFVNIINNNHIYGFCLLNENILFYGGSRDIYIFDINEYKLLKKLDVFCYPSLLKLENNIILVGENEKICQYNIKENDLIKMSEKKIDNSPKNINNIIKLKQGIIISCSNNNIIKIWK